MQAFRDPVNFYLVVLPYTRALHLVGRKGKTESTEDQGLLGTRLGSGTYHILPFSTGQNTVTWALPDHKKSGKHHPAMC